MSADRTDAVIAEAEHLAKELEVNGYEALPCWSCGRWGIQPVHSIHELLRDLLAECARLREENEELDARIIVENLKEPSER